MPTKYKGDAATVRALNAFINLARAADSLSARVAPDIEASGLTPGQFGVLEAILHLGPMSQRALGAKLLRSGGNITLVVDNLEKRSLVRRERQPRDRRALVVHLTATGRRLIEGIFPAHARAITREMSPLSARDQEDLRRICRKFRGAPGSSQKQAKGEKS